MLQIAVCDDEQADLIEIKQILTDVLAEKNRQYYIDTFSSGEELLNSGKFYHFVLLDIAMKGKDGIETGKEFRKANPYTQIIYITNLGEFCGDALNRVHAFAYLDKPITRDKLQPQIIDVLEEITNREAEPEKEVHFEIYDPSDDSHMNTSYQKFRVADIYYFEYINRRVRLRTEKEEFFFQNKMMELVEKMSEYSFSQCHQSFLINLAQVKRVKGYEIYMQNGDVIPLAQKKSVEFRAKLNEYMQRNM